MILWNLFNAIAITATMTTMEEKIIRELDAIVLEHPHDIELGETVLRIKKLLK